MREKFWKWLAKRLYSNPWLVNRIMSNAKSKPYYDLQGYMERWWLTPRWMLGRDEDGNLHPHSWVPMLFRVRLHHILRADIDRHLHDHPADNRSIVLRGFYDEQDIVGRSHLRNAGDTVLRRAECFHKIAAVPADGVWTLWFLGKKRNEWGFLVGGRKVPHELYLGESHGE